MGYGKDVGQRSTELVPDTEPGKGDTERKLNSWWTPGSPGEKQDVLGGGGRAGHQGMAAVPGRRSRREPWTTTEDEGAFQRRRQEKAEEQKGVGWVPGS